MSRDRRADRARRALSTYLPIVVLARTIVNVPFRIVYPFLPTIARGLGISLATASSLVTLRLIGGLSAPLLGPLVDRYGRRRMMEVALTIFVLASLLMSGVGTFLAAGLGFLLYGIAKALYDPAVYAYLGDVVPYHRRGRAIGIVELSWSAAWLLGVPASGSTMELFGWRAPWTVLIGLGLLSGGLIHVVLPPISRSSDEDKLSPLSTIATWTTLLRRRSVIVLLLVNLLLTLANEIPFIVYGAWLEASFGLSLTAVGLASVVVGLAEAIAEFGTVAFTDRLGKKRSVLVGLLGLATSLVALPWLSRLGLAAALVGIVLMMLSFEFSWVSLVPLATELAPDSRATLLSLNSTSSNIARILGAFVGGWLWYGGSIALHAGVGIACVFAASLLLVWGMTEGPDP